MNKLFINRIIVCIPFVLLAFIGMQSCSNNENEYSNSFFNMEPTQGKPTIDFSLINSLNESNQKIIKLSNATFEVTKDIKTLQMLLIVKKNHQEIDSEIEKLTQKNLIFIPKLIYNTHISSDFIKSKNADLYLFNELATEIKKQITLLDSIENTTQNIDFKIFAMKSKKKLENDSDALNITLTHLE